MIWVNTCNLSNPHNPWNRPDAAQPFDEASTVIEIIIVRDEEKRCSSFSQWIRPRRVRISSRTESLVWLFVAKPKK
jgi:hypothetical protein